MFENQVASLPIPCKLFDPSSTFVVNTNPPVTKVNLEVSLRTNNDELTNKSNRSELEE